MNFDILKEGNYMIEYDPQAGEWTKREWAELDLQKNAK